MILEQHVSCLTWAHITTLLSLYLFSQFQKKNKNLLAHINHGEEGVMQSEN